MLEILNHYALPIQVARTAYLNVDAHRCHGKSGLHGDSARLVALHCDEAYYCVASSKSRKIIRLRLLAFENMKRCIGSRDVPEPDICPPESVSSGI